MTSRKTAAHKAPSASAPPKSKSRHALGTAPTMRRTPLGATMKTLKPGDLIDGKYRIMRSLGSGGMGSVYAAKHVVNGSKVAIKVLHPSLAALPGYTELFLREGAVDNRVDEAAREPLPQGPGAVRVFDNGRANGVPYMVMEKLDGKSLHELTAGRPIDPTATEVILDEVLQVLEGAHNQGIVHRDIKPENLFVTNQHDVRVLDFGLAQMDHDPPGGGGPAGTLGYAPPEQVLGMRATPASDVWGVGATGYALLTGKLPVSPSKQEAALKAQSKWGGTRSVRRSISEIDLDQFPSCPVPSVLKYAPDTPPALAHVIDRALACDPSQRYPNATAMRADLERAIAEEMLRSKSAH